MLEKIFQNKKALIIYLTAGFPTKNRFIEILTTVIQAGADIVEIGVPFSDPIADGPTIQYSSQIALKNGVNIKWIFDVLKKFNSTSSLPPIPFVIMSYYNPILNYGIDNIIKESKDSKVYGYVIPDLSLEESYEIKKRLNCSKIDLIQFITPTTLYPRIKKIISASDGFVYVVSVTGVTGARKYFPQELKNFLIKVKSFSKKPIALGFGISKPKHLKEYKKYVDGFIIGSRIIDIIKESQKDLFQKLNFFIKTLKNSLRS